MDVAEPPGRDGDVFRSYLDVAVDFGPLAVQALPGPGGYLGGEFGPDVPGGDEAARCSHTWVCGSVEVVENLPAELQRDQGSEGTCGGVA